MKLRAQSDKFPTITLSSEEFEKDKINSETLKEGFDLYIKNGCLLVKNVFSSKYIKELHKFNNEAYGDYFQDIKFDDALKVGDKCTMITIDIKGLFNSPKLYANQLIFPLLEVLLSKKLILGFFGSVTSLPNASDQHVHRDNPHIFDQPDVYEGGEKVLPFLPPYGITVSIPLIPLNEINGTTRMFLGSHLVTLREIRRNCEYIDPVADTGDCLFMDWRLMHGGTANKSSEPRPIIYLEYFRHWYRDVVNFNKQKRIQISAEEYAKIPQVHQHLFNWTTIDSSTN